MEVGTPHRPHDMLDTQALLSVCCLVNKTMLPFAQAELYKRVVVYLNPDEATPSRSEQLLTTLQSNATVAALVKNLLIAPREEEHARSIVQALVGACTHLEGFGLTEVEATPNEQDRGWLERSLARRGETLQLLDVGDYPWSAELFAEMLLHLGHLKILDLGNSPHLDINFPRPSFRLRDLRLYGQANFAPLDFLLGASQESLVILHFGGISAGDVYDFSTFPSLRTIHLTCHIPTMPRLDLLHLFQSLGTMPSLETLKFGSDVDDDVESASLLEEIDFLRLLPSSILRLEALTCLVISTPYILDFLRDRRCLPALQLFEVGMYLEEHGDEEVKRPREERKAIGAAAAARGIELGWQIVVALVNGEIGYDLTGLNRLEMKRECSIASTLPSRNVGSHSA